MDGQTSFHQPLACECRLIHVAPLRPVPRPQATVTRRNQRRLSACRNVSFSRALGDRHCGRSLRRPSAAARQLTRAANLHLQRGGPDGDRPRPCTCPTRRCDAGDEHRLLLNLWVRVAPFRRKSTDSALVLGDRKGSGCGGAGIPNSDVPPPSVSRVDPRPRFLSRRGGAGGLHPG